MTVALRLALAASLIFALAGCNKIQSALSPQGAEAAQVATLFWIMTWVSAAILLGVMILAAIAIFGRERWRSPLRGEWIVIGGGIVFPSVLLSALLVAALLMIGAESSSRAGPASVRIAVVGEQWWWRVVYRTPDGRRVESANEIRIPAGERVAFELSAADVIHSLWVPTLAGKLDMIPGRENVLNVIANEPGVSRGQCAEYCGGAHALMSLYVVALERQEFDAWLQREAAPAPAPAAGAAAGQKLFFAGGCGACHTIRGTEAAGTIGPDLTHLGGRMSLAAAVLPNDAAAIARWIRDNQHIKPDNKMPPYGMFTEAELKSLANYLAGLK
ncbi:MAG TPA: c-type cytochrome [Xanthobacteraceae bacterium]|nr:c-type cytochrome [Xanthobacteraceae bacterium]